MFPSVSLARGAVDCDRVMRFRPAIPSFHYLMPVQAIHIFRDISIILFALMFSQSRSTLLQSMGQYFNSNSRKLSIMCRDRDRELCCLRIVYQKYQFPHFKLCPLQSPITVRSYVTIKNQSQSDDHLKLLRIGVIVLAGPLELIEVTRVKNRQSQSQSSQNSQDHSKSRLIIVGANQCQFIVEETQSRNRSGQCKSRSVEDESDRIGLNQAGINQIGIIVAKKHQYFGDGEW